MRKSVVLRDAQGAGKVQFAHEKVLRRRVSKDPHGFPKHYQARRSKLLISPSKKKAGDEQSPPTEGRKAPGDGTLDSNRTLRELDESTRQRLKKEFEESARSSSLGLSQAVRYPGERHLRDIIEQGRSLISN